MPSSTVTQASVLTRRGFLLAIAATSVLSLAPLPAWALTSGFDVDAFLAFSEKETEQTGLSKDDATAMLKIYADLGKEKALADLASGQKNQDLANSLVTAWYTGESPNPDDLQVLDYTDTLIWQAMDYTKPMGYCGGAVGYWAEPPEA